MSTTSIFAIDNFADAADQININDLFDKKKQADLNRLTLFKKILHRAHARIKYTGNHTKNKHCIYVVPEIIIGVNAFDQAGCIAFMIDSLKQNKFAVDYYHPNTLWISWSKWVPEYVREQIRKKTGIVVDEFGETVLPDEESEEPNEAANQAQPSKPSKPAKTYTQTNTYRPSGKLMYDPMDLGYGK